MPARPSDTKRECRPSHTTGLSVMVPYNGRCAGNTVLKPIAWDGLHCMCVSLDGQDRVFNCQCGTVATKLMSVHCDSDSGC